MRIAIFVSKFPSLSETFILDQITGLLRRGHEADIFAGARGNLPKCTGVAKYKLLDRAHYSPELPLIKFAWVLKGALLFINFYRNPGVFMRSLNIFKYGRLAASLQLLSQAFALVGRDSNYDIIHCHFSPTASICRAAAVCSITDRPC